MVPADDAAVAAGAADAVKLYKIRVSSRYIDLTRQKLELARLPHEGLVSKSIDWWEPKADVESLIDFWLEQYSWRTQEDAFNAQLAETQFRTAFTNPAADPEAPALRLHFIHVQSTDANAVPLLLIPPFPFANLSLAHLVQPLVQPAGGGNASTHQAFNLVIPALPGLGFSDALPNNAPAVSSTADMFNSLMLRLGYDHYLVSNAASGTTSPAHIDFKLVDYLASCYPDNCLGAHLIAPPLAQPTLKQNPMEWVKWTVASTVKRDLFGYKALDFASKPRMWPFKKAVPPAPTGGPFSLHSVGLREPNTVAYALCDSPTGLLVQVMNNLRTLGPNKQFTHTEVLNFTQLSWLPGPEAGLRFWASCTQTTELVKSTTRSKPRVAITVFQNAHANQSRAMGDGETDHDTLEGVTTRSPVENGAPSNIPLDSPYACPAWANLKYQVVHATRATGPPGLLAWERPELIAEGARSLATAVLKLDARLKPSPSDSTTSPLAAVVVDGEQSTAHSSSTGNQTVSNGVTAPPLTQSPSGHLAPPATLAGQRQQPERGVSDDTQVSTGSSSVGPSSSLNLTSIGERIQPTRELSDETAVNSSASQFSGAGSGLISPLPAPNSSSSLPLSGTLPPSPPPQTSIKEEEEPKMDEVKAEEAVPSAIVVTPVDNKQAST